MAQLFRFLLVGLANTGVGLLCIWGAMRFLDLNVVAANFIGYGCGLALSFTLNRSWTFAHNEAIARSLPRWLAMAVLAYLVNLAIVLAAHRLGGIDPYLAQPLGIGAYTAIMFLGSRYYVFCNPRPILRETE
jgi:putative flippase GtrA